MNVALFGGTFDPVHLGHLAVARAAQQRFGLKQVHFVPASVPPHKQDVEITAFAHRYAMLVLATQGEKDFIPSLLEYPEDRSHGRPDYTLDTVRRFRQTLGRSDRVYFLIGIDAFREISTWHESAALLREVEFIVVSRPGFSLADVADSLPDAVRPAAGAIAPFRKHPVAGELVLPGVTIHLLEGIAEKVSATQVRAAAANARALQRYVPAPVADYIRKFRLYQQAKRASRAPAEANKLQLVHGGRRRAHPEGR